MNTHTPSLSLFQCILITELVELQVILSVLYYHSTEQGMPVWDQTSATGTPTECTPQEMLGGLFGILYVSWAFCSKPMQLTSGTSFMNQNDCVSIKCNSSSVSLQGLNTHIYIHTLCSVLSGFETLSINTNVYCLCNHNFLVPVVLGWQLPAWLVCPPWQEQGRCWPCDELSSWRPHLEASTCSTPTIPMRFNTSNLFHTTIPMKTSTCPTSTIPMKFNTSNLFNSNHTSEDFNLSNLNHTSEVQYSSNLFYTPIPMKTLTRPTPSIPMRFNTSNLFDSSHTNEDVTCLTLTIPMRFNTSNLFTINHISVDFNLFNTNHTNEVEHFQPDYNHQSYHYQCSLIFWSGQHPLYNYKWG